MPSKCGVSASPWGSPVINPTGLQSQMPWGFLVLLPDPQAGKPDVGLRTFTTVGELLWYYYSPVCESLSLWVWDLTFAMMASLLPSHCDFFLVFERGVSFPSGFQCPPVTDSSIWSFHIKR